MLMYKWVVSFHNGNESNDILSLSQLGFHSCLSTSDALLQYMNEAYDTIIDNSEYLLSAFLDLRKAFDCVDIEILLKKLGHIGFMELLMSDSCHSHLKLIEIVIRIKKG